MIMTCTAIPLTKQQGASLIEVLVAVLILSLGIIAMAGIHSTSLKLTRTNQFRLSASQVAEELGEAIKANPRGALPPVQAYDFLVAGGAAPAAPPVCNNPGPVGVVCTPATIAAIDIVNARNAAARTLPQGDVFLQYSPPAAGNSQGAMTIWVHWVLPTAAIAGQANVPAGFGETACPPAVAALNPPRGCVRSLVPV
jgi:type IV pilus assembly protein PilV